MDWMYSNCSATAQRGALDWKPKFKKATLPVFKDLYNRVKTGKECARVLSACGAQQLPGAVGKGTGRNPQFRNVARRRGFPRVASQAIRQGHRQRHQGRLRTHGKLKSAQKIKSRWSNPAAFFLNRSSRRQSAPTFR